MIQGTAKERHTLEDILSKVTEYDIFKYYIGGDFTLNDLIENPWESQNTPSFLVSDRTTHLTFRDFSDTSIKGNIVEFLKRCHPGKNYDEILTAVVQDLGTEKMPSIRTPPKRKGPSIIQVTKRSFDTADLEYWKSFHQTKRDLEDNEVYAVKSYRINGTLIKVPSSELAYAYLFTKSDGDFCWKLYRPYAKDKKDKWRYSGPNDLMVGLDNLTGPGKVLITKSLKDYLVIRKVWYRTAATQSEALESINEDNLLYICSNGGGCSNVYINFDSDAPGKKASNLITRAYGFSHINVPDEYMPIKDFAELGRVHGLGAIEQQLKLKGIL
jgi:hypothetical protein